MQGRTFARIALLVAGVAGCSSDPGPTADAGAKDAGPEASDLCPDPSNARVHYRDRDPNVCSGIVLDCTGDQNGFHNRCGCGCIDKGSPLCPPVDDPAVHFISRDPAVCGDQLPICPQGDTPFNDTCGCGCTTPGG